MLVVLIAGLLLLLFIDYTQFDCDFFSPSVLACLGFLMAAVCCLYNHALWGVNLHFYTVFLIWLGVMGITLGEAAARRMISSKIRKQNRMNHVRDIPICVSKGKIAVVVTAGIISTWYLYQEIKRIANLNYVIWGNLIYNFKVNRRNHNLDGNTLGILTQLLSMAVRGFAFVCGYIFIYNMTIRTDEKSFLLRLKRNILLLVPVFLYYVQSMMKGGRIGIIAHLIMMAFLVYFFQQRDSGWNIGKSVRLVKRALVGAGIISVIFYEIKELVGRIQVSNGLLAYITNYFGGSVELFDQYLFSGLEVPEGIETLPGILNLFHRAGLFLETTSIASHEYRNARTGIYIGNSYSAFRNYHHDFGMIGVFVFCLILGFLFAYWYQKIRNCRLGFLQTFSVILYGSLLYSVIFQSFTDYFFSQISLTRFMEILLLYLASAYLLRYRFEW